MNRFKVQIITIVTGGLLGWSLLYHSPSNTQTQNKRDSSMNKQDKDINKYLKHTYFKRQLKVMAVDTKNNELAPQYNPEQLKELEEIDKTQWGVDLRQERGAH